MKTLFMETTKIPPDQTVATIQGILGKYGAGAVMTEYDKGEVSGLTFKVEVTGHIIPFRLPCRWQAIDKVLRSRVKKWPVSTDAAIENKSKAIRDQARRIAWRQILRWVEAQMALVETDMVKIQEVFMPYVQMNISGSTLYELMEQKQFQIPDMRQ